MADIRSFERCRLLTLVGIGITNRGLERRLLLPFDTISPFDRVRPARWVRPRSWWRACRAVLAEHTPAGSLRAARLARMELLCHQLEPAIAAVHGHGSRFLLADDVGLGKTVQAGLAIAELRARGCAERVLVLTPAGLREQWVSELSERFGISSALLDFHEIRRRTALLPIGVNPWSTVAVAIASIDYVKRPEVLPSILSCRWDALVIDEAHNAAHDSERHTAVSSLAARAGYVFLLSATPHSGDERAFTSLCAIGGHGDRLVLFRRTRADVRLGSARRVHQLHIRPGAAEARMHARLSNFTRAVRAEHDSSESWLALSVLHKRALSSARSLEQSVERRLATLDADGADRSWQPELPLADPGGEFDEADKAPNGLRALALGDRLREREMLETLAAGATAAAVKESKVSAILRLLRRIREPILVFTEFRDTLAHLCLQIRQRGREVPAMLHGGLTREERNAALEDFGSGRRRILLATDAAGEGLNLHHRCRIVVNLELPWNPMRLEQRIGRVDRIGQRRTVHVFHLIARGTGETKILDRLNARISRARQDIPVSNPLEDDERAASALVIDRSDGPPGARDNWRNAHEGDTAYAVACLESEAAVETARLALARRLSGADDVHARSPLDDGEPWLTRTRRRATRIRLKGGGIALLKIEYEDGHGRIAECVLLPLAISGAPWPQNDRRAFTCASRVVEGALGTLVRDAIAERRAEIDRLTRAFYETRAARERAINQSLNDAPVVAIQPGLFDRRAEHAFLAARLLQDDAARSDAARLAELDATGILSERPPRLLLLLVP